MWYSCCVMFLKEKITVDLVSAMKAKDELRTNVLRMVKAAIQKFEVAGKEKCEAKDEDVVSVLQREMKQRRDAVDLYTKGGREDLAKREEQEIVILSEYLPKQLSEGELMALVKEIIEKTGAQTKADTGKVMGQLMGRVKGQADGKLAQNVVASLLK